MPVTPAFNEGAPPRELLELLPDSGAKPARALAFDQVLASRPEPPTDLPASSFDLIWSLGTFTRLVEGWAEWLLELRRLLAEEGRIVIGLADRERFERLTGEAWEESRMGMTVLDAMNESPQPVIFHSEWWLQAHWGRAFGRIELVERDGLRHALLSGPVGEEVAPELLERPAEGDKRELAAANANASHLRSQVGLLAKRHRHELVELREETDRELMRRSFAEADLEWARRGPGSPATLAAAQYEATTSWRLTRPLRALGAMIRRRR
jgi:SAM-dependent methyltransferase